MVKANTKTNIRQRLRAEDRRASILALSRGLFAKKGLNGVSVNEIADECGVSPAVLYQHFDSKEALYEAVIEELACKREDYVDAVLSGPPDFGNVLYRMTAVFVKSHIKEPDSMLIELRSLLDSNKASEQFFNNQWQGLTDFIRHSIDEMQQTGQLKDIDISAATLAYVGLIREAIFQCSLRNTGKCSEADATYLIKNIVDIFLRGLGLPPLQW